MERRDYQNKYQRIAYWDNNRHVELIRVRQDTGAEHRILGEPEIAWASTSERSLEFANEFYDALGQAIAVALEWDKDTGELVTDVLKDDAPPAIDALVAELQKVKL